MSDNRVSRFEFFVLKPLSIAYLVAAVLCLLQSAWFIGGFFLVIWFLIGRIGASLHKGKTFRELARGTLPKDGEAIEPESEMTEGESYQLSKLMLSTSSLIALTAILLSANYGIRWYFVIPLGFAVLTICNLTFALITLRPRKPATPQNSPPMPNSEPHLFDAAIIGAWHMDARSRDFKNWSAVMLADSSIQDVLRMNTRGDQEQYLRKIYNWSNAMLVGAYHFKEGTWDFEAWRGRLWLDLDTKTQQEIKPHIQDFYRLAADMKNSIGHSYLNKPIRPAGAPYDGSRFTVKVPNDRGIDKYFIYDSFNEAMEGMKRLVGTVERSKMLRKAILLHDTCPHCGEPLRLRIGKNGPFWACSDYPADNYVCQFVEET